MTVSPAEAQHDWPPLDATRPLMADGVLVLAVELDCTFGDVALLDAREQTQAARLRGTPLKRRYIAAHCALRRILGWRLGRDPATLDLVIDQHGKPHLRDGALVFNLSHSGGWALVALADDGVLGVDLELGERLREVDQLAMRVFDPVSLLTFRALPTAQRGSAFLAAWTRKEAALKALGLGLPAGMEHVLVAENPLRLIGDHTRLPGLAALHLHDLPTLGGGAAALCQGPRARTVSCQRWPRDATAP